MKTAKLIIAMCIMLMAYSCCKPADPEPEVTYKTYIVTMREADIDQMKWWSVLEMQSYIERTFAKVIIVRNDFVLTVKVQEADGDRFVELVGRGLYVVSIVER